MAIPFPIIADPTALTITVGPVVFDRPDLARRAECWTDVKANICGEASWDNGPKAAYQYYASQLGAKFNRRFQAANYWLWLGNRLAPSTGNILRAEGRHWKNYHPGLIWRTKSALPYIKEAEHDGLHHLIPIIVAYMESPQEIRRRIGQGAWRRIAHNSLSRNVRIMHAVHRARRDELVTDDDLVVRLLDIPSGVMRAVQGATPDEVVAARISPRKRVEDFQATVHLVRDTRDMKGLDFNPSWSLARMGREHRAAIRVVMQRGYSDKPFAPDWSYASNGFTAMMLTSQLDIAEEGAIQHHCVAAYAKRAAQGRYAVLRIEGKERATAGFVPRSGQVDQVYGACNQMVSDECYTFALAASRAFSTALTEAA